MGAARKRKKATPRSDRQHGSKIPNSTPRICIADSNQCQKYEEFSSACTSIRHVEPRTTTILCNLTAILVRVTGSPTLASEHAEDKTSGTGQRGRCYSGTATAQDQALYVNDLLTLAKVPGNEGKKAR